MQRGSVIPKIVDSYDRFTDLEKTIADYFIYNRHKEDFSIRAIKEKLFVSEATLTRFAQKSGFRGYREFIFRYEEEFLDNINEKSMSMQDVLNTYNQILKQVPNIVDDQQIERVAQMINDSGNVLVVGIGSSGYTAREMKSRFTRLGVHMEAIDYADEMRMQSVFQKSDSLVIGISLSGKKESVLFALKRSSQNGAKTVLITANKDQDFPYVTEKILVPSFENLRTGNEISPQFPILIIVDICYNYFIENERLKKLRKELHKKTIEALEEDRE